MARTHTYVLHFHSFSLFFSLSSSQSLSFKAASLPLYILGKSLSELEKGPWGHRRRFSVFFFLLLWIIDSHCLVIHRLHMPANSSEEEKLPTSQPCTAQHPTCPQKHPYLKSLTPLISQLHIAKSHICMHAYKHTFRVEFSPLHHDHPPAPEEPGARNERRERAAS